MTLPPFPIDEQTLALLSAAIDPDPETADRSSVGDLCVMFSELGGSDTAAVAEQISDNVRVMRDPQYHPNDILKALIGEVRTLRAMHQAAQAETREAREDAARVAEIVRRVRELHARELFGGVWACLACSPGMPPQVLIEWPCPTADALGDAGRPDSAGETEETTDARP